MTIPDFQRARSAAAKQLRESAILEAARELGAERGIRQITLTEIAEAVGMHKSALLRYFETREEIFLRLTADGWREWSAALRAELEGLAAPAPAAVADAFATTLAARGLFCDLLAQAPLNLERNVSLQAVRAFKLVTLTEVDAIVAVVRRLLPGLTERDGVDLIAAATALSGAFWQMATPGPEAAALYRSDPRLAHAVVDVEPRVARLLEAMLEGMLTLFRRALNRPDSGLGTTKTLAGTAAKRPDSTPAPGAGRCRPAMPGTWPTRHHPAGNRGRKAGKARRWYQSM